MKIVLTALAVIVAAILGAAVAASSLRLPSFGQHHHHAVAAQHLRPQQIAVSVLREAWDAHAINYTGTSCTKDIPRPDGTVDWYCFAWVNGQTDSCTSTYVTRLASGVWIAQKTKVAAGMSPRCPANPGWLYNAGRR